MKRPTVFKKWAAGASVFLKPDAITAEKAKLLDEVAAARGQSLAEMVLSWVMRILQVCSLLIGASRLPQIEENVKIINRLTFTEAELSQIEEILKYTMKDKAY